MRWWPRFGSLISVAASTSTSSQRSASSSPWRSPVASAATQSARSRSSTDAATREPRRPCSPRVRQEEQSVTLARTRACEVPNVPRVRDGRTGGPHFAAFCERYLEHTKGRWAPGTLRAARTTHYSEHHVRWLQTW